MRRAWLPLLLAVACSRSTPTPSQSTSAVIDVRGDKLTLDGQPVGYCQQPRKIETIEIRALASTSMAWTLPALSCGRRLAHEATFVIVLDDGRRTRPFTVPPPEMPGRDEPRLVVSELTYDGKRLAGLNDITRVVESGSKKRLLIDAYSSNTGQVVDVLRIVETTGRPIVFSTLAYPEGYQ